MRELNPAENSKDESLLNKCVATADKVIINNDYCQIVNFDNFNLMFRNCNNNMVFAVPYSELAEHEAETILKKKLYNI